jgi:hypothetical protein
MRVYSLATETYLEAFDCTQKHQSKKSNFPYRSTNWLVLIFS